jgi:hypothetical protein
MVKFEQRLSVKLSLGAARHRGHKLCQCTERNLKLYEHSWESSKIGARHKKSGNTIIPVAKID